MAEPESESRSLTASRNDAQAEGVSLFRQSDFLRFWLGESVSWLGSQVTVLALPLAAISTLRAPVRAVGFLAAAGTAAMTVVMPFAGPWLDARPVRPVIIATNVLRAAVLMSVPLAFSFSAVSMPLLYMVALAVGAFSGVFDIAVVTYVPRLVHAARLVDANSMVGASGAVAETAGPAVGGALIRLFTAPVAILADVFSYLVSTVLLVSVRKPEYVPRTSPAAGTVARRVSWGIRYCLSHPRLRLLLIASAWFNLWEQAIMAVFLVYALRVLSVSATVLGIFLAAAGCGAAAGSAAAAPAGRRLGLGKILAYGAGVGETHGPWRVRCVMALTGQNTDSGSNFVNDVAARGRCGFWGHWVLPVTTWMSQPCRPDSMNVTFMSLAQRHCRPWRTLRQSPPSERHRG